MAAPSILWVKINEAFGFVGISAGESMADLDEHLTPDLVDAHLGTNSYDAFCAAPGESLDLPAAIAAHLAACFRGRAPGRDGCLVPHAWRHCCISLAGPSAGDNGAIPPRGRRPLLAPSPE